MAARLKGAGFTDSQLTLFATPDHPKEGGLVAVYPGTSTSARPLLLIAHIDVVEAKREDWERDPFTLFEENGYFYARGVAERFVTRHHERLVSPDDFSAIDQLAAMNPANYAAWRTGARAMAERFVVCSTGRADMARLFLTLTGMGVSPRAHPYDQ